MLNRNRKRLSAEVFSSTQKQPKQNASSQNREENGSTTLRNTREKPLLAGYQIRGLDRNSLVHLQVILATIFLILWTLPFELYILFWAKTVRSKYLFLCRNMKKTKMVKHIWIQTMKIIHPADHEWSLQTQVSIIIIYTLNSLFAHQFNTSNKM